MRLWLETFMHDWRLIQAPLYGFVGAIFFAALILLLSHEYRQHAQHQLHPMQTQLNAARAAAASAEADYLAAAQNKEHYLMLQASGIIGQEHRLAWVARLNASTTNRLMTDLRYRIEPQKPLDPSMPNGNSMLYASKMRLQYVARHEEAFSRAHHLFAADPGRAVPLRLRLVWPSGLALRRAV